MHGNAASIISNPVYDDVIDGGNSFGRSPLGRAPPNQLLVVRRRLRRHRILNAMKIDGQVHRAGFPPRLPVTSGPRRRVWLKSDCKLDIIQLTRVQKQEMSRSSIPVGIDNLSQSGLAVPYKARNNGLRPIERGLCAAFQLSLEHPSALRRTNTKF